MDSGIS